MFIAFLFDFYKDLLTDKQADAIDLYYNEDLSLAEISEHLGITRQGVRDNIKRGEAILLEMEEKMGAANRFKKNTKILKSVLEDIDEINEISNRLGLIQITDKVKNIKERIEGVINGI